MAERFYLAKVLKKMNLCKVNLLIFELLKFK